MPNGSKRNFAETKHLKPMKEGGKNPISEGVEEETMGEENMSMEKLITFKQLE